ncbi:Calcineurin-like phosphoesterase domain-containing protein [Entamoeba marina]
MEEIPRRVFAIGDIHLNLDLKTRYTTKFPDMANDPDQTGRFKKLMKDMTTWGLEWENHINIVQEYWDNNVNTTDVVILAGDVSWTRNFEENCDEDIKWISNRPGIKVICKGNHDYWFPNNSKKISDIEMRYNVHILTHNHFYVDKDIFIVGTRLVDYEWNVWPPINPTTLQPETLIVQFDEEKQKQEITRTKEALKLLQQRRGGKKRIEIFVTHHPPFNENGEESIISKEIVQTAPNYCVFGHIHTLPRLYELENVNTVKDISKMFKGVDCVVNNTQFKLVTSDLHKHCLVLLEEFTTTPDTTREMRRKLQKQRKKKEKMDKKKLQTKRTLNPTNL